MKALVFILTIFLSVSTVFPQLTVDSNWLYKDGEKVFIIGAWGLYKFDRRTFAPYNDISHEILFREDTEFFNTYYLDFHNYDSNYMDDKILLIGNSAIDGFRYYVREREDAGDDVVLRARNAADSLINFWESKVGNAEYIYYLDEPINGGTNDWFYDTPPSDALTQIETMVFHWHDYINANTNKLTWIDFGGPFSSMQTNIQNYPSISASIFSMNDFWGSESYYDNISVASSTIDEIKSQKNSPALIYAAADYAGQHPVHIETQRAYIYTSIVHGATGVIWWGAHRPPAIPWIWERIKGIAEELKNKEDLFKSPRQTQLPQGPIHYCRYLYDGEKVFLAVNTSHTQSAWFNGHFHGTVRVTKYMAPREVFFAYQSDYQKNFIPFVVSDILPLKYSVKQNYPNPFNPTTAIKFGLPETGKVKIIVYNSKGQEVRVLANQSYNAGYHEVTFDASDLPSGIYFYRMNAGDYTAVRKMLLVK
jgi:hypothetical protein